MDDSMHLSALFIEKIALLQPNWNVLLNSNIWQIYKCGFLYIIYPDMEHEEWNVGYKQLKQAEQNLIKHKTNHPVHLYYTCWIIKQPLFQWVLIAEVDDNISV